MNNAINRALFNRQKELSFINRRKSHFCKHIYENELCTTCMDLPQIPKSEFPQRPYFLITKTTDDGLCQGLEYLA